jgi:hypothetical protein
MPWRAVYNGMVVKQINFYEYTEDENKPFIVEHILGKDKEPNQ